MRREQPGPGQESVWDYPRPPRIEPCPLRIRVEFAGEVIADTLRAYRLLETSHPPGYYLPPSDVRMEWLEANDRSTHCEFKGQALYWDLHVAGRISRDAAWSYPSPTPAYPQLRGYLCFYASRVDACYVDNERVRPQPGEFYGGWITSRVVGPFKGGPGTGFW